MNIFEKYDSQTWHKNVGFPCISILDPNEYETVYTGRNPYEFFKEFDIKFYQHCIVTIWHTSSSYVRLGTIAELKNKFPVIKLDISFD
jgi:hypothetical protein